MPDISPTIHCRSQRLNASPNKAMRCMIRLRSLYKKHKSPVYGLGFTLVLALGYLLAVFVGRFPRYYLLALLGNRLAIPTEWIILMLVVLLILPVSVVMSTAFRRKYL